MEDAKRARARTAVLRFAIETAKSASAIPNQRIAKRSTHFTTEEFWRYQSEALKLTLRDAVDHVRYYQERRRDYSYSDAENTGVLQRLSELPVLAKETVRETTEAFWREPRLLGSATHTTGGSTGTPLSVRAGLKERGLTQAIMAQRSLELAGTRNPRILRCTGLLTGTGSSNLWMHIPGTRTSYLNIYQLTSANREQVLDRVRHQNPQIVHGYASALLSLARLIDGPGALGSCRALISTSETLADEVRFEIEETLGVPVIDEYGSQEGQHLVFECPARSMHIHPLRGVVELLRLDSEAPAGRGELGRVVVTGLHARSMPLVRYAIGDVARSTGYQAGCSCGSGWPTIGKVVGRQEDLVKTRDGRRIGLLSHSTLKDVSGVREAQIVQHDYDEFSYRLVVKASADRNKIEHHVESQLTSRLGYPAVVRFEYVPDIIRGPSGKFRAVQVDF